MNTRLYLGKLGSLSKSELMKICSQYGSIKDFMMKDNYAFVEFSSEYEAKMAQLELDGRSVNGQRIAVEFAKPKSGDSGYFSSHPRLYIGRLNAQTDKAVLTNLFSKHGEISEILVKDDFAFIEFTNSKSAQAALKEFNGYAIGGTRLVVEEARPKDEERDASNLLIHPRLYIGKLGENVRKQDLVNAFSQYGEILDILMKDDFAFLEFSNVQAATKALLELNGAKLCGSKIIVEEAKPREGESFKRHGYGRQGHGGYGAGTKFTTDRANLKKIISRRRRSPYRSLSRSRSRSQDKDFIRTGRIA